VGLDLFQVLLLVSQCSRIVAGEGQISLDDRSPYSPKAFCTSSISAFKIKRLEILLMPPPSEKHVGLAFDGLSCSDFEKSISHTK
jgi:hypothetical protein